MVVRVGETPEQSLIAAVNSNNEVLTCVERLDNLFDQGMKFEAAVSQMAIVEALLLFYLKSRIQADGVYIRENIEQLRQSKRLTFGKVKDIVIDNAVFHDNGIEDDLKIYVGFRNDLAHNLVATFSSVDLEEFYKKGRGIINFFHSYLLSVLERHKG